MGTKRSDISKDVAMKMFLGDTENFIERGVEDLEEDVKANDVVKICGTTEKSLECRGEHHQCSNTVLPRRCSGQPLEEGELLEKLEEEELGFWNRYGARERYLHMKTFYDGVIELDMLRRNVDKAEKYVGDVKNLAARSADQN